MYIDTQPDGSEYSFTTVYITDASGTTVTKSHLAFKINVAEQTLLVVGKLCRLAE